MEGGSRRSRPRRSSAGPNTTPAGGASTGCPPTNGNLRVTVVYRYGSERPLLRQARVEINGPGGTQNQTTGDNGVANFRCLQPGGYNIRVTHTNTTEGTASASVASNRTAQARVEVIPRGTLRGRVIDADNTDASTNRIEGAQVSIVGQAGRTATTNAQGEFQFTNLESGSYQVRASKTGYADNTVTVDARFRPGGTVNTEIRLRINVQVQIGDVSRGAGLPNSVPPNSTRDVSVTITPSLAGTHHNIRFDVINGNANNGTATITANATRTASGNITVTGGNQTAPGNAGQLRIRARLDGTRDLATSNGFSVCAHVNNITNALVGNTGADAIRVTVNWGSDSGGLDQCFLRERVTYPSSPCPAPFQSWSPPNPTILPGGNGIVGTAIGSAIDTHSYPPGLSTIAAAPVANSFSANQWYQFNCHRCNSGWIDGQNYTITRETIAPDATNPRRYRITKTGAGLGGGVSRTEPI